MTNRQKQWYIQLLRKQVFPNAIHKKYWKNPNDVHRATKHGMLNALAKGEIGTIYGFDIYEAKSDD